MEKKNVFLELPCELIEKIDRINNLGDRSAFITGLLEKQIEKPFSVAGEVPTEIITKMTDLENTLSSTGEINIVDSRGTTLGTFDINTLDGFEGLAKKIREVSEHPVVQVRADHWL